jgi:hypothetical protein
MFPATLWGTVGRLRPDAERGRGGHRRRNLFPREEAHEMRTIRHSIAHFVPPVGMGLLPDGLFGGLDLPAASAAGVESFTPRHEREYQNPSGSQDSREQNDRGEHRHDQLTLREPGYGLPDRSTIRRGQTRELRCERIRRSLDVRCREYRC